MAAPYINTPATERGDGTFLSPQAGINMSFVQPFGSPSKNPAESLRNRMRGMNGPQATPRARNPLVDKRNPPGQQRQEFTPLLKSAKRKSMMQPSIPEEKENGERPDTPEGFRSSYGARTPGLPINSSMVDGDHTSSSAIPNGGGSPGAPAVSSSMYDSTPIPQLPKRGEGAVLDQGNVLTLRDQEAKLDQIQKDNFGLKLKIHYLEEALRRTGSDFHQATVKENVELKTAKVQLEQDLKRQRKRLQDAAMELEEYRQKYEEYQKWISKRQTSGRDQEEVDRLQRLAEQNRKLAEEREQELDEIRQKLEDAEGVQENNEGYEKLKEEIQDLEADIRDRERQLDEKEDQLETLQDELRTAKLVPDKAEDLQEQIDDLNAQLQEKDEELDAKDAKIEDLEERVDGAYDREKSTKKLRADVVDLESQLREKQQKIDELDEYIRSVDKTHKESTSSLRSQIAEQQEALAKAADRQQALEDQIQADEVAAAAEIRRRDHDIQNTRRELADKDGEVQALQERLSTARGSWDAEAHQTDARLMEKDQVIREKEARLREKTQIMEQRDDELADLQARLQSASRHQSETAENEAQRLRDQAQEISDLEEKLRVTTRNSQARLREKDELIQAREKELETLQNRISTLQSGELQEKNELLRKLQSMLKQKESAMSDQDQQITSLRARLGAMETPSKKDSLLRQQAEQVQNLQRQYQKLEQEKDGELDELEKQLQDLEVKNADFLGQVDALTRKSASADRDRSMMVHKEEDLEMKQARLDEAESQVASLQTKLQRMVERSQEDARRHERELELLRSSSKGNADHAQQQLSTLKADLQAEYAEEKQLLEDEILVLGSNVDELQAEKAETERKVKELERQVRTVGESGTPTRERNELRLKVTNLEKDRQSLQARIEKLESELRSAAKSSARNDSSRELREVRLQLKGAQTERDALKAAIVDLESQLETAIHAQAAGTPVRERNEFRKQLRETEAKNARLQAHIENLQADLEFAQQEKTFAVERIDLHNMLKEAKLETEELQALLSERDRKIASSAKKEGDLRAQLATAQDEVTDLQAEVAELQGRLQKSISAEKEHRAQLKGLKETREHLQDLEVQLGERKGSSSGHARKEADLKSQLRECRAEMDALRQDVADRDHQIEAASKKEQQLRNRLKRATADDTLQGQVQEAERELRALQKQLSERAVRLQCSLKREQELRQRYDGLQKTTRGQQDEKQWTEQLASAEKRHEGEIKGLVKQIQYLRARCVREETFRSGLVYTKQWFLMQVEMYNRCNRADLRLIEEMGITPDESFREKKHSLRTVGTMVVATIRMQNLRQAWAKNKKVHESLLRKLEGMKKQ